jgi:enoyl-CoA hydratase/carnithine racemase
MDKRLETRNEAGEPLVTEDLLGNGVLLITLNRPERFNAWIEEMELQYYAAFDRAVTNEAVRAIVLTGAGRSFCPGMDIKRLAEITDQGPPYMSGRRPQTFLRFVPKPVVAAVNGACAGIGFVQAVMADVRFTAPAATWSVAFSRIGLVAEDGVAWRLQRLCGHGVAADLLLSSRRVAGTEAAALGLANRVVEPDSLISTAVDYAAELAIRSPMSLALIKRQLLMDADDTAEASRQRAVELLALAKMHPDYAEGVRALFSKTIPAFSGLPADHGYLGAAPTW